MNGTLSASSSKSALSGAPISPRRARKRRLRASQSFRIKQEPAGDEDIKDYAETTMNELLGWYGYEKLDSRETQSLNLQHFTSASTSSNGSSSSPSPLPLPLPLPLSLALPLGLPLTPSASINATTSKSTRTASREYLEGSPSDCEYSRGSSVADQGAGGLDGDDDGAGSCRSPSPPGESSDQNKEPSEESVAEVDIPAGCILCAWCQKVGMKLFTLRSGNGCHKAFCSELCFTQCRRASFKKNKVCDWCKHVRHTVNYVDFQDGENQLQFCSDKCLTQYKMNIFCRETQAHLQMHPHLQEAAANLVSEANSLITPDLWLRDCKPGEALPLNGGSDLDLEGDLDTDHESVATPTSLKRKSIDPIDNSDNSLREEKFSIKSEKVREKHRERDRNGDRERERDRDRDRDLERNGVMDMDREKPRGLKRSKHSHRRSDDSMKRQSSGHREMKEQSTTRSVYPPLPHPPLPRPGSSGSSSHHRHSPGFSPPRAANSMCRLLPSGPPPLPAHIPHVNGMSPVGSGPPVSGKGTPNLQRPLIPPPSVFPPNGVKGMFGNIGPGVGAPGNGDHLRMPFMPPNFFGGNSAPNLMNPAYLEMMMRMHQHQQGLATGLRQPLPFPPTSLNSAMFPTMPPIPPIPPSSMPGAHSSQPPPPPPLPPPGQPLPSQPPFFGGVKNGNVAPHPMPNSLLPPPTVMVPYPFMVPVPVPIPIPFPILLRKPLGCDILTKERGIQVGAGHFEDILAGHSGAQLSGPGAAYSAHGLSAVGSNSVLRKVDSVITRLVEKKANNSNAKVKHVPNDVAVNVNSSDNSDLADSLDLSYKSIAYSGGSEEEPDSDREVRTSAKNLVVSPRKKKRLDTTFPC